MLKFRRAILTMITTVPAVFGYLLAAIFIVVLRRDAYFDGSIVVIHAPELKWWPYSTTVTRVIFLRPKADATELAHELVHVRRAENYAVIAFLVATIVVATNTWLAVATWLSAATWPLVGYGVAFLRGEDAYRDADDEREARALNEPGRR